MGWDPIAWDEAELGWSREGYFLRCPLWAEERALYECEAELRRVIAAALSSHRSVAVGLKPAVPSAASTSRRGDPGELKIVTETIVSVAEADALRQAVTPFLQGAIDATDRLVEADRKASEAALEVLRRPPTL